MAQKAWLLKVLSGSHAGAELELHEPSYLLGSDDQCDLVFSGKSLAARHLQIQLKDGEVRVKLLAKQPVTLDGRELKTAETALQAFQVLGIGALRFALAPVGEAWPDEDQLIMADLETHEEAQDPEADKHEPPDAEPTPSPPQDQPDQPQPHSPSPAVTGLARHWLRLMVVVMLLIASSSATYRNWSSVTQFFHPEEEELSDAEIADPVKELKKIITRMNLDLHLGIRPDGRLRVYGYVESQEEKKRFLNLVKKLDPMSMDFEIKTFESIKRAVERVLSSFASAQDQVDAAPGDKLDELVLTGYVVDEGRWRRALSAIRSDVPDIRSIDNRVETLGKRLQALQAMLRDHGLEQILFPKAADGRIILEGKMPKDRLPDWEKLNRRFDERYNGMPRLVLAAQVSEDNADWLSRFQVDAVSFGRVPYFTLQGQKYIVGSRLANGYTVERINKNSILFQAGGHHYTYYFGEGEEGDNKNQ